MLIVNVVKRIFLRFHMGCGEFGAVPSLNSVVVPGWRWESVGGSIFLMLVLTSCEKSIIISSLAVKTIHYSRRLIKKVSLILSLLQDVYILVFNRLRQQFLVWAIWPEWINCRSPEVLFWFVLWIAPIQAFLGINMGKQVYLALNSFVFLPLFLWDW